jgi:hypothetical protein
MLASFETLVGLVPDAKPWECVGDVTECRVALRLAAMREDRAQNDVVQELALRVAGPDRDAWPDPNTDTDALLEPIGEHHIPAWYLPAELRG